ncbi:MAG: hypothetical protein H5T92_02955 [Synergistales bacterium]|nr:hypothetical protein [Synergistales bacterium]HHV52240.1 hypothetical protein [Synergistaceae bacterium]
MARTDRFKGQHRELVRIVAEISSLAEAGQVKERKRWSSIPWRTSQKETSNVATSTTRRWFMRFKRLRHD